MNLLERWRERRHFNRLMKTMLFILEDCDITDKHLIVSCIPRSELEEIFLIKNMAEWYAKATEDDEKRED